MSVFGCGESERLMGWPTTLMSPSLGCLTERAMPRCLTCGSAKVWSMVLIGPHGTPALFRASIQCADGLALVTAAMPLLTALRCCERRLGVACPGLSTSSGAPIVVAQRLNMLSPDAAMLI